MRVRIEQTLREGRPEIAVLFGGANDAIRGSTPQIPTGTSRSW
jgi:hypothetical protein